MGDVSGVVDSENGKIEWRFDAESNTVFIRGNGKIKDFLGEPIFSTEYNPNWEQREDEPDYRIYPYITKDVGGEYESSYCVYMVRNAPWVASCFSNLVIEKGIVSIGSAAFYGCNNLKTVTLPDGLESIGRSAFQDCSGIKEINLPDGLKIIEESAFQGCGIKKLVLPDSVQTVGNMALPNDSEISISAKFAITREMFCTSDFSRTKILRRSTDWAEL